MKVHLSSAMNFTALPRLCLDVRPYVLEGKGILPFYGCERTKV